MKRLDIRVCLYANTYGCVRLCKTVCMFVYVSESLYACVYVCVCVCMKKPIVDVIQILECWVWGTTGKLSLVKILYIINYLNNPLVN